MQRGYISSMCDGSFTPDCERSHNHCTECPDFGKCIFDYRNEHCPDSNDHFFAGLTGHFPRPNCVSSSPDEDYEPSFEQQLFPMIPQGERGYLTALLQMAMNGGLSDEEGISDDKSEDGTD
eukprot:gb/GECG01007950.1/.p1 GENE.gb/GECG01007950.1/~~gb/GECG01007950.1/.p1  ORF type:complete len:121 (+),score=11.14 gb/GECG01007950.1/:1-363(+)